jgi:hypothetical protein
MTDSSDGNPISASKGDSHLFEEAKTVSSYLLMMMVNGSESQIWLMMSRVTVLVKITVIVFPIELVEGAAWTGTKGTTITNSKDESKTMFVKTDPIMGMDLVVSEPT